MIKNKKRKDGFDKKRGGNFGFDQKKGKIGFHHLAHGFACALVGDARVGVATIDEDVALELRGDQTVEVDHRRGARRRLDVTCTPLALVAPPIDRSCRGG